MAQSWALEVYVRRDINASGQSHRFGVYVMISIHVDLAMEKDVNNYF